ncbi:MAG: hypothetical protein RLZZ436_1791 [Planctomycetota bacterium]
MRDAFSLLTSHFSLAQRTLPAGCRQAAHHGAFSLLRPRLLSIFYTPLSRANPGGELAFTWLVC